jgi:phage terminase large subunit-like protein
VILEGKNIKIVEVSASRGKEVRAQPVSSLFELGKWHHVGRFPELQKQWTQWVPGTKPSPDRLDAEVWLATHYLVGKEETARVGQGRIKGWPSNSRHVRSMVVRRK